MLLEVTLAKQVQLARRPVEKRVIRLSPVAALTAAMAIAMPAR